MDASGPAYDVMIEENGGDSDAELEAAVVVEEDIKTEASDVAPQPTPVPAPPAGPTATASPFKLPPNPTIPQDLSIIMDLVANNEVVGSLPSVSMSAAEKRKLVEASLSKNRDKGKGKEEDQPTAQEKVEPIPAGPSLSDESSSEFESSSEEETDSEAEGPAAPKLADIKPMTVEEHGALKKELDDFVGQGQAGAEVAMDSEADVSGSDVDSDEDGDLSYPNLGAMGFEFMEDDEDDVGPSGGAAITSTHEAPLPPVALPPMEKLPQGEGVSLAGDVVSWMREKKVEAWLEKKAKEEEEAGAQAQAESFVKVEEDASESKTEDCVSDQVAGRDGEEEKQGEGKAETKPAVVSSPTTTTTTTKTPKKQAEPRFTSSGTVVVRAMQSRPGAADEGWLEEGSVLCWEDGRVLGTVHETFGPLTSPFYTIRLPPPPFPYPTSDQLTAGTRLFYPLNPSYRSFVNMLALRDPRLKGSDASNLYDEEIGEDEVEWSDDEAEAEAKKRRKQRRAGSKTPSLAATAGNKSKDPMIRGLAGAGQGHGLPARPHFDYQPSDETAFSETGSMYGGDGDDEGDRWENMSVSDVGSTASTRGRPKPAPYDLEGDESMSMAAQPPSESGGRGKGRGRGGRGGGAGGRGQGRERGTGRGRGGRGRGGNLHAGGSGGGGGRSDPSAVSQPTFPLPSNPMTMGTGMGMSNQLPMNPMLYQNPTQNQAHNFAQLQSQSPMPGFPSQQQSQFNVFPQQQYQHQHQHQQQHQQQFVPQPNSNYPQAQAPFQGYPHGQQMQVGYNQSPVQQGYSSTSANNINDTYEPHQPATGMPSVAAFASSGVDSSQPQHGFNSNQQSDNGNGTSGGAPAINPRFAAQYQQMLSMNMNMGMGMGMNQPGWHNQNPYNQ
ncbi:hypothetical protein IAU59_003311 [Kwoniella sp. CBS 9459]